MATRNAHILRQGYLKNFTDTGTKLGNIFCYDLEKQKYIDNNGNSTKGMGRRVRTYTQRNEKLKKGEDKIEQRLGQDESKITSGIDGIIKSLDGIKNPGDTIDRSKINEEYIVDLILLILTKIIGERAINHQGVIEELTKKFEYTCSQLLNDKVQINKFGKESIEKDIEKIHNEFNAKNQAKELFSNALLPVEYMPIFIQALYTKNWMLSYIRDENYEFCISDFPIYLRPDNNSLHSFVKDPKVELHIPLSKNLLLSIGGGFERKRQYSILSSHDELIKIIKQANQMLIVNATWYVAGSKKSFVDELINSKEINPYTPNFFSSIDKILKFIL